MNQLDLPTRFDYLNVEKKWNDIWEKHGYFHPEVDANKKPFSIAFPPPNVTGNLHMGHAANATVQDTLIRTKRMQGYNTLWILGTDHAGIGTQVVVEKKLKKEEGLSRHDLGREAFLEKVWEWKEESGSNIINQMKRLGASGDYDRERFTMDENYSKAIRKVFVDWYEKGLIYRDNRLVNWDYKSQTVLSDLEVESEEEKGHLWHLRYPLTNDPERFIIVATTRPETMLGDTAVAVHPEDERYKDLIGQTVNLPLTNRKIPIIGDGVVADPEFGSGAVKITPAHDFNDWECGQRNNLELIQVIGQDAKMNENAPEKYQGLSTFKARDAVVADLDEQGFLVKVEDHIFLPGRSSRTGAIIEPLPMVQWWVNMKPLAEPARKAIRDGKITYHPSRFTDKGAEWLEDVRDWCISRQLWWGHQIPVWYDKDGEVAYVGMDDPDPTEAEAKGWSQEPDVLDTWFSSSLWTFATLGWPEKTPELEHFHPTSILSTARDIINLWVARMIFCSLYFLDEIPFSDVLIHATILTKDGKRMSKSKGTGIDPLVMLDKYGADACRFWLAEVSMSGQDVRFSDEKLESSQHFVTKIWNASRFILQNLGDYQITDDAPTRLKLADKWILSRLQHLSEVVTNSIESYELTSATKQLYQFIWNEFCSWYLELAKPRLQSNDRDTVCYVLTFVLDKVLKLLHPFMPFISEEIWSYLKKNLQEDAPHLIVAKWISPEALSIRNPKSEANMQILMEVTRVIRNLRMEMGVPANKMADKVYLISENLDEQAILSDYKMYLSTMAKVTEIEIQDHDPGIEQAAHGVYQNTQVILPLAGLIDFGKEKERLQREIDKLAKEKEKLSKRLDNKGFVDRAPVEVVQKARDQMEEFNFQTNLLQERLDKL